MKSLQVKITPAIVDANFSQLKTYLEKEVAEYEIEVTDKTVTDAKKLAIELNAVTTGINKVKKEQLAILEKPANIFKEQIAELNNIVQGGRGKILSQVKVFEDKTKETIKELLEATLEDENTAQNVGEDFRTATIDGLVILTSITKTGNLTNKAVTEIVARVATDRATESLVELRLLQLENECYKAGLKVPLSPEYIKDFLRADETRYKARLSHLISVELRREEEVEARAMEKANREAKAKAKAEEAKTEEKPTPTPTPAKTVPTPTPTATQKALRITFDFDILVRQDATQEQVNKKMRDLLAKVGITNLNDLTIREV